MKTKKMLAVFTVFTMALVMTLCGYALLSAQPVYAEDGTEPVQIGSWEDLKGFIDGVNDGSIDADTDASLTDDITVPDTVGNDWVPLGADMDHAYQGIFDGAQHSIKGINIDRHDKYPDLWKKGTKVGSYTAFISFLGEHGTVKDLTVEARIIDVNDVAGIVSQNCGTIFSCTFQGYLESSIYPNKGSGKSPWYPAGIFIDSEGESGGIAAASSGTIRNCMVQSGTQILRGGVHGGGIAGIQTDGGVITECTNRGDVAVKDPWYKVKGVYVGGAGGIVGGQMTDENTADPVKSVVSYCYNYGKVTSYQLAGGIIGNSYSGDIIDCVNFGTVDEVEGMWGGGIAGYFTSRSNIPADHPSEISGCKNFGPVDPSAYNEKEGKFEGAYIGGIVGHIEEDHNMYSGGNAFVTFHDNLNEGSVTGNFAVGGVIGKLENSAINGGESLVYNLANLGAVAGNQDVAGITGACPGVMADTVNYGAVTLIPLQDEDDYYYAAGIAGECGQTATISTSYNIGAVTAKDMSGNRVSADNVFLGGVFGGATFFDQDRGCYYCAELSGEVDYPVATWENVTDGMLKLEQMGGEDAKTNMPALFDGETSLHPDSNWKAVENITKDGVTYYMTPQISGPLELLLEDIQKAGVQPNLPFDIGNANVFIMSEIYTGQELVPFIKVHLGGLELTEEDYDIELAGPYIEPGTYDILVKAKGDTYTGTATGQFVIEKMSLINLSVKPLKKTVKAGKSFKLKAVIDPAVQGDITYSKKSGNKKITISKTGKVKVKKGLKKGKTYKVKVIVSFSGTSHYEAATATETLRIKIKK